MSEWLHALLLGILLGAVFGLVGWVMASQPAELRYQEDPAHERIERIASRNVCWTGAAPKGAVPEGAIATLPGRKPQLYPASVGYDIWLHDHPGVLHAFCKRGPKK